MLRSAGHDAVHVRDYKMQRSSDEEIFARAADENRMLISADTDFGTLLALREETAPSVILLRRGPKRPQDQVRILLNALPIIEAELSRGCIAVLGDRRIRVRRLPIGGANKPSPN